MHLPHVSEAHYFNLFFRQDKYPDVASSRLSFVHVHVLYINDTLVSPGLTGASGRWSCSRSRTWACTRTTMWLRRPVHVLGQLMGGVSQPLVGMLHSSFIVRLQSALGVGDRILDLATFDAAYLVASARSANGRTSRSSSSSRKSMCASVLQAYLDVPMS